MAIKPIKVKAVTTKPTGGPRYRKDPTTPQIKVSKPFGGNRHAYFSAKKLTS